MKTDSQMQSFFWDVLNDVIFDGISQFKSETSQFRCMSIVWYGQTTDDHVSVADCFHFVDFIAVD